MNRSSLRPNLSAIRPHDLSANYRKPIVTLLILDWRNDRMMTINDGWQLVSDVSTLPNIGRTDN